MLIAHLVAMDIGGNRRQKAVHVVNIISERVSEFIHTRNEGRKGERGGETDLPLLCLLPLVEEEGEHHPPPPPPLV